MSKMERAIEEVRKYMRRNLVVGAFVRPGECMLGLSFHGWDGGVHGG